MIVALICLGVVLVLAVLWALGTTDMHRASCVVLAQRNGPARQAAIYHMCATDESLRNTLVAMGACVIQGRQ